VGSLTVIPRVEGMKCGGERRRWDGEGNDPGGREAQGVPGFI